MRAVASLLLFTSCWAFGAGSVLPSGQFRAINIPLKEVIKFAYSVRDEAIVGAPAWIGSERYDINGKAADSGRPECTRTVGAELRAQAICKSASMADLARALQIVAPGYANREVVDLTGIEGAYELQLDWVGIPNIDSGGLTMPGALEKQLGLKLEPRN